MMTCLHERPITSAESEATGTTPHRSPVTPTTCTENFGQQGYTTYLTPGKDISPQNNKKTCQCHLSQQGKKHETAALSSLPTNQASTKRVLSTWEPILSSNADLPNNWLSNREVLVGRRMLRPPPEEGRDPEPHTTPTPGVCANWHFSLTPVQ